MWNKDFEPQKKKAATNLRSTFQKCDSRATKGGDGKKYGKERRKDEVLPTIEITIIPPKRNSNVHPRRIAKADDR